VKLFTDFTQGELSPRFKGRPDLELYHKGALEVTNFVPFFPGGITYRPGFGYVGTIGTYKVRLIPFIISDSLAYILEFRSTKIRIWKNGALLVSGGNPVEITTAYTDPFSIQYAQDSASIYIVSSLAPIKVLSYTGADSFTFTSLEIIGNTTMPFSGDLIAGSTTVSNIPTTKGLASGQTVSGTGIPAGTTIVSVGSGSIVVSAAPTLSKTGSTLYYSVTLPFQSSGNYPRTIAIHDGRLFVASTENEPNAIWASKPFDYGNFTYYEHIVSTSKELREPLKAFTGTTTNGSTTVSGISAEELETMNVGDTIMGPGIPYDYPDTVTRIESKGLTYLVLDRAATESGTVTLYASWHDRSFPEYTQVEYIRDIITPSNAYKKTIASDINETILWLASGNDLILGSTCGERVIPSGANATNFICKKQTAHGSAKIQPILFNDAIVFVGPDKKVLREYVYRGLTQESQSYNADRVDQFADHILTEVIQIEYSSSGTPIIWAVQNDGTLIGCVHDRRLQLSAFFRVSCTNGLIESVCVIPESGKDTLYASINRSGTRSLEKLGDLFSGKHLDSWVEKTVSAGSISGVSHISGSAKLVYNGAVYSITITDGAASVPAGIPNDAVVLVGRLFTGRTKLLPVSDNPMGQKMLPRAKVKVLDSYPFRLGVESALSTASISSNYSGDVEIQIGGGWDTQGVLQIEQEGLPLSVLAIALDVKTGG